MEDVYLLDDQLTDCSLGLKCFSCGRREPTS